MPDTPSLQEEFGQPDRQQKGCGFPVAKVVAMWYWEIDFMGLGPVWRHYEASGAMVCFGCGEPEKLIFAKAGV